MYFLEIVAVLFCTMSIRSMSFRLSNSFGRKWLGKNRSLLSTSAIPSAWTNDVLISGLNKVQDISVRVVSCKDVLQRCINNNNLVDPVSTILGELIVCGSTLSSTLKGEETCQLNVVGGTGNDTMMMICDGSLNIRARYGKVRIDSNFTNNDSILKLFEPGGQIQKVHNHPVWKSPVTGITALRNASLATNLALHIAESEQRTVAMLTAIKVENKVVDYAVGVLIERMPPVIAADGTESGDENLEQIIANAERIQRNGLSNYITATADSKESSDSDTPVIPDFFIENKTKVDICPQVTQSLHRIMDEIFLDSKGNIDEHGMRWFKSPKFKCSCGLDKVWHSLAMLTQKDVKEIAQEGKDVEVRCDFCGSSYNVTAKEVEEKLLVKQTSSE